MNIPYRPQTKLRKGNVFTSFCHSVYREGGLPSGQRPPGKDLFLCKILLPRWGGGWGKRRPFYVKGKSSFCVHLVIGGGLMQRTAQFERPLNTAMFLSLVSGVQGTSLVRYADNARGIYSAFRPISHSKVSQRELCQ